MSKPIFVPTATPVENVGFTPDPNNPRGWPPGLTEGERPFDWKPEFRLVNGHSSVFATKMHNVSIVIRRAEREERRLRSFVLMCHEELYRDLAPGKSISWEEVVYWDRNGVVFPDPGAYTVSVEARWFERGQPLAAEASSVVWVDYPLSEKENAVAAALLDDEVGKYVALGGNAVHLKRAVARIADAKKAEAKHPAIHRIAQIDERAREIKKQRSAGKKLRK